MFNGNKKYYFILIAIFTGVVLLQYNMPKPINWTKTYFKKDKIPFGCFVIYNLLQNTYCNQLEINTKTFYDLNNSTNNSNNTFIAINDELKLSTLEYENLIQFINKGNNVLLCANNFSGKLKDTLKLNTKTDYTEFNIFNTDSLIFKKSFDLKYVQAKNNTLKNYTYPIAATNSFFQKLDTLNFSILAVNGSNKTMLIKRKFKHGNLILCSTPDVFANIFIANNTNRFFTYTLLSSIKNKTIIWDEYFKTNKVENKSMFQFIFNNDALYMAYALTILGLIFFMIFEMKRKQKAIPIIQPLQNTTLNFVDVISQVYFNSKNHKYIAEEQIQYFYFDVRKKFGVNTTEINDFFFETIHTLSGVSMDSVKNLFKYCENLKEAPSLTENDLLELNNRITNFKQKSIR